MVKLLVVVALLLPSVARARVWTDIVSPTVLNQLDANVISYLVSTDPFFSGVIAQRPETAPEPAPRPAPVPGPAPEPTTLAAPTHDAPTPARPTPAPTTTPTPLPTESPTSSPTNRPSSLPTAQPTDSPDPYPPNEPPSNPMPWYFNYDISDDSSYGPGELGLLPVDGSFRVGVKNNNWGSVSNPSNSYWNEFTDDGWGPWKGVLENRDPSRNLCETGEMQSPIDVRENGATCDETHEVRSLVSQRIITFFLLYSPPVVLTFD
jgi:hypothetical protein